MTKPQRPLWLGKLNTARSTAAIFGDQSELRSFSDIWEGGRPGYLICFNARLQAIKRLLKKPAACGVERNHAGPAMNRHHIEIPRETLAAFCRSHHIRKLSLFGSILRDVLGPESDVDFLVEFEPGKTPGLFDIAAMEIELSEIIGRKADLRTAQDLSRYFRETVVKEAELQYVS